MVSTSQLSVIVYIYVKNYSSTGIFTRFNVKSRWSKNICDIVLYSEWVGNVWKSPQAVKHRSFDQLVVGYGCYYVKKFNPLGFGFGSGSGSGLLILGDPVAVSLHGRLFVGPFLPTKLTTTASPRTGYFQLSCESEPEKQNFNRRRETGENKLFKSLPCFPLKTKTGL